MRLRGLRERVCAIEAGLCSRTSVLSRRVLMHEGVARFEFQTCEGFSPRAAISLWAIL